MPANHTGERLTSLEVGMAIPYAGDRVARVTEELAEAFQPGDRLIVVQTTGDLLHVPADVQVLATKAVDSAVAGFARMGEVSDDQITTFYEAFARRLEDEDAFAPIAEANAADVESAQARGRTTTRLELTARMRDDMVAGLRTWGSVDGGRGEVVDRIDHDGWTLEQVRAGLGVVAFVFEGRPNVFADATGVLRSGNTVVFRIGSDALGTARAIRDHALAPAMAEASLPDGAVVLVDSPSRAAGHALFSDRRLGLAVARGSGPAVAQLGAVASQTGTAVSLHGTGGAWLVVAEDADPDRLRAVVQHSLDRKVCNTLNTCCVVASGADRLVHEVLAGLRAAADGRNVEPKLRVTPDAEGVVPDDWRVDVRISRADGEVVEPQVEPIDPDRLGHEWEWEDSPEMTLHVVSSVDEAVALFNDQAPRFVASIVSEDEATRDRFFAAVDAPFVGDGFTRWVDGQYALDRPELGLSNWEGGRLLGRGAILSGDSVFTVRARVNQHDPEVHR